LMEREIDFARGFDNADKRPIMGANV